MTDTQRTLALVAFIAAVIAVLMIGSHQARIEPTPQPEPIDWSEIETCVYSCPVERPV